MKGIALHRIEMNMEKQKLCKMLCLGLDKAASIAFENKGAGSRFKVLV